MLEKRLKELGVKTAAKALRAALTAAAKPVVEEAKKRVPVRTGKLRDNIVKSVSASGKRGAFARIGFRRKAFYGQFVETGTSKMPARPFLRPALDNKGKEAVDIFTVRLKKRIDKITAAF